MFFRCLSHFLNSFCHIIYLCSHEYQVIHEYEAIMIDMSVMSVFNPTSHKHAGIWMADFNLPLAVNKYVNMHLHGALCKTRVYSHLILSVPGVQQGPDQDKVLAEHII